MTVTYRPAARADAALIAAIFESSFCDTFAHLYRPEDLAQFLSGFSVEEWEKELGDRAFAFRIADADGVPVGYVKLGPFNLPLQAEDSPLLLRQIYLLKPYRGLGIAQALMEWAIAEAVRRAAKTLYLTVYVDNDRARRLYERYGFEAVGRYDFMVGSHADQDVIMRKRL